MYVYEHVARVVWWTRGLTARRSSCRPETHVVNDFALVNTVDRSVNACVMLRSNGIQHTLVRIQFVLECDGLARPSVLRHVPCKLRSDFFKFRIYPSRVRNRMERPTRPPRHRHQQR